MGVFIYTELILNNNFLYIKCKKICRKHRFTAYKIVEYMQQFYKLIKKKHKNTYAYLKTFFWQSLLKIS